MNNNDYTNIRGHNLILDEADWIQVKRDIDSARDGSLSPVAKDRLIYYDLWDKDNDKLDEFKVRFLFIRYA